MLRSFVQLQFMKADIAHWSALARERKIHLED
jgi:hypothetical protein